MFPPNMKTLGFILKGVTGGHAFYCRERAAAVIRVTVKRSQRRTEPGYRGRRAVGAEKTLSPSV